MTEAFRDRHIGTDAADQARMLAAVGAESLDALMAEAVPAAIALPAGAAGASSVPHEQVLPPAATEAEALAELRALAGANRVTLPLIGLGYHGTITPAVIERNVLENPSWYTAYTPYQPEISQGRLEALLNFQTVVTDLTGLHIAGASMLDEATAAAEAMLLARRASKSESPVFLADADALPATLALLRRRAEPLGIEVREVALAEADPAELPPAFGVLVQYPGASGRLWSPAAVFAAVQAAGGLAVAAADLLALTLVASPGELGADLAVGSTQRFGVPIGYGGPHAGYLAVRAGLERQLPGRLVGVSIDADGAAAYRLALQTREQHIRREKATSNICTAQVLLAVTASMYAVYHGPEGLRRIAAEVHAQAHALADAATALGVEVVHADFFDTVQLRLPGRAEAVWSELRRRGVTARLVDADTLGAAFDEASAGQRWLLPLFERLLAGAAGGGEDVADAGIGEGAPDDGGADALVLTAFEYAGAPTEPGLPAGLARGSDYLTHPVFHAHRSETALMRYLKRLADADYALDRGMIPLGSCTMKLNAATEMAAISWPEFASIHPLAPAEDAAGYHRLIADLETWLAELTGYDAVSLQPNAGSQGELAGLLAIRDYHRSRGEAQRTVCLIPASAHGTNAASAVLAGMRVVVVATDAGGDVDLADLHAKIADAGSELAALMITYPSTHGVYEAGVRAICDAVHAAGGQVYIDGANLNALVGWARPGDFGGDVSHLNLHKTFAIPHGGGGPGIGPVAAKAHLAAFLPAHLVGPAATEPAAAVAAFLGRGGAGHGTGLGAEEAGRDPAGAAAPPISAAAFGSAGVLPISWAYARMMGPDGLRAATASAVLAANYVAARLGEHFPVLYAGAGGRVAHECILDLRPLREATGITVDDVAKRLIDYGFHAPTMSFPVVGTLMVEPTESEDLAEIDRFIAAMTAIRGEADRVAAGEWPADDNPLVHAPHTAASIAVAEWAHPYSREQAVFPAPGQRAAKYWPPVRRIDGAHGDRNLVCSCQPVAAYA